MAKKRTKAIPGPDKKKREDAAVYKVRVALTASHYVFVTASCPDAAERKARAYIRDMDKNHGGYDWLGEASHLHETFEVEEAE